MKGGGVVKSGDVGSRGGWSGVGRRMRSRWSGGCCRGYCCCCCGMVMGTRLGGSMVLRRGCLEDGARWKTGLGRG